MKKLLSTLMLISAFIFSHNAMSDMSDDQKINIAKRACRIAEATPAHEVFAGKRMELIENAREKLGKGVVDGPSDQIETFIRLGECMKLIIDKYEVFGHPENPY